MERNQTPLRQKSSSFSSSTREEKLRETDRNLSLGSIRLESSERKENDFDRILEKMDEENAAEKPEDEDATAAAAANAKETVTDFATLSEEIDQFLGIFFSLKAVPNPENCTPPEIPESVVENFVTAVEKEIVKYESGEEKWSPDHDELSLLAAIDRISKLTSAVTTFSSEPMYGHAMSRAGGVLHHAMSFLEDEFHALLLEDSRAKPAADLGCASSKIKRPPSFGRREDADRCVIPSAESNSTESAPAYPPETVERLRAIAAAMIAAEYGTECCQVFTVARRNAFEAGLSSIGYEKSSIDDVLKMAWEALEGEIAMWIKTFRQSVGASLSYEHDLCHQVFAGHCDIASAIFHNFARGVVIHLLNFVEAVAMTKRSAEKLFKVLDMYEALRDSLPMIEALFPASEDDSGGGEESSTLSELRSEINSVRGRLGEGAVAIFCELESSIKSDMGKTPVPGGAVHPLTRYVMNYLKYACEYKNTLEQVFKLHHKPAASYDDDDDGDNNNYSSSSNNNNNNNRRRRGPAANSENPFAGQLIEVMDLLHANLDAKSKLYKDLALSNIFLMNNGRYVVQKIKGSAEINALLGDSWGRKRSSDLRQYHKNYQRETWSRVLACFKDDGLTVKGTVQKPVLKERLKSFNAMFEEIHKTQSAWVVSDEQLQSELRVSVSAVVVPAYRSFLGRFSQYLNPGRQTEKYVKFGPDDLENYIDELFDGNPTSMARRR
ncbi:exocyst complex component EXO70B1-like [Ananas comosus]|uniref:Exocyst subunit Exo70 family protein n=1 Tax=Ananas comosus TaxID=4615 RepID=A0A6P5GFH8_ANACO|nr:exocyst complex component EXO70B1-like [Ananas comosus]